MWPLGRLLIAWFFFVGQFLKSYNVIFSHFRFIRHAIDILSKSSEEPLLEYYDPTKELANSIRLQDTISQYHPRLNEFVFDAANKKFTSVRIPQFVQDNGYGYFEDRRPSSELDPYSAADGLVRACIFGDFLKPEYQHLKDLRFWDKE